MSRWTDLIVSVLALLAIGGGLAWKDPAIAAVVVGGLVLGIVLVANGVRIMGGRRE